MAPAHPTKVAVSLDSAKAASATIPSTGGTLMATGTDGTIFTLTIPDGALMGREKVTMTPVASIRGLPFAGGLQAAVQLEPDGLQLFAPATLAIKFLKPAAIASQVGFAYHGSGEQLFLYPPARLAELTFRLFHFSGMGGALATKAEVAAQAKNEPTSPEDQAAQDLAAALNAILAQQRQDQLTGVNGDDAKVDDASRSYVEEYFAKVVKPNIERALVDDTLIDDAINTALGWLRSIALLGVDNGQYKAMQEYIAKQVAILLDHATKAAYDRCFVKHDPSAAQRMLFLIHMRALVGVAEPDAKTLDNIQKCLTFKLDFTSNGPFLVDGCSVYANGAVKGLVLKATEYTGSVDMTISGVAAAGANCGFVYSNWRTTQPFRVFHLTFQMNYVNDPAKAVNPQPEVSDVVLTMDPGDASIDYAFAAQPDQKLTVATYRGEGGFAYWHRGEGGEETGNYVIADWTVPTVPGVPFVATKKYDRALAIDANGTLLQTGMTEHTTFTLTHAPGA